MLLYSYILILYNGFLSFFWIYVYIYIYIYIYIYTYISLGISSPCSFVTVSELFCCELFNFLYYYINFRSLMVFSHSFGYMYIYISLDISLSWSFPSVSELICCQVFKIFEILSAILILVKTPRRLLFFEILFLQ